MKALAEALGKSPITVKNAPGFVVNRILVPMINEAFFVLAEGLATPRTSTRHEAGLQPADWPVLALADMIGLDVCLAVMDVYLTEFGDSKYRPARCSRKWWPLAAWAARRARAFTRTERRPRAPSPRAAQPCCALGGLRAAIFLRGTHAAFGTFRRKQPLALSQQAPLATFFIAFRTPFEAVAIPCQQCRHSSIKLHTI